MPFETSIHALQSALPFPYTCGGDYLALEWCLFSCWEGDLMEE